MYCFHQSIDPKKFATPFLTATNRPQTSKNCKYEEDISETIKDRDGYLENIRFRSLVRSPSFP